jgi:tetratricopeptide (TPR) repeat protein
MNMGNANREKSPLALLSLIVSFVTLALVAYMLFVNPNGMKGRDYQVEKNLAGELADNNLYLASIDDYKRILEDPSLENGTRANIHYLIGKSYFENLLDYENAAANFIRARSLNPKADFYDEAGRNLIISLEKMGRVLDAKRELDNAANIDGSQKSAGGKDIVATVGERPIYLSDIENDIQSLPPEVQKRYLDKNGKMEILQQRIAVELMYQDAVRNGMDKDSDILRKQKDIEKQLIVEKYAMAKIMPQINIDTADVKNYYQANKKSKYGDKSYDEVSTKVLMDYQQEKSQRAFSDYVAKLAAVEKVQVFEENVK